MTAAVREFTVGSALLPPVRHDDGTERILAEYRTRRKAETLEQLFVAAARLGRPEARRHPLCAEFRAICDAEIQSRHLSLAPLAVTR